MAMGLGVGLGVGVNPNSDQSNFSLINMSIDGIIMPDINHHNHNLRGNFDRYIHRISMS